MTRHTCSRNEDTFYVVYLDTKHESPNSFTMTAHRIIKHEVLSGVARVSGARGQT